MLLWNPEAKDVKLDVKDLTRDPGITVYCPSKPNGIAVIMCPGGGYSHQAINHEGHDMAAWFNAQGITYAVLKYRLPQGDPTLPLSDAEQAVRILRTHAGEWGINPAKIGIMGASAGGHLASMLSTHYSDSTSRPDFQVLLYPVVTMDPAVTHAGSRTNLLGKEISPQQQQRYSNELQVTPSTPQAFIVLSSAIGQSPLLTLSTTIQHSSPIKSPPVCTFTPSADMAGVSATPSPTNVNGPANLKNGSASKS